MPLPPAPLLRGPCSRPVKEFDQRQKEKEILHAIVAEVKYHGNMSVN